ncbi:hypothetical protein VCHC28A1_1703, partial [Vibrio cholerae HC-28A1]
MTTNPVPSPFRG